MKPARGLFTPKARARHRNVDRDDGDIRLVQFVHDDSPELGVRLKLNDKIDVTNDKAFSLGKRRRTVQAVVGHDNLDARRFSVFKDTSLNQCAERMSRCKMANPITYFSPFLGGVTSIAALTIAIRFSAVNIEPSCVAGSKP